MDRALNGVEEPLYSYGALIGTRTRYNDRLLMFMLRNRAPHRFADGGSKAMSAVDAMQVERLKKQWRAEWESESGNLSPEEARASIDHKINAIRCRVEAKQAAAWAKLSEETRDAWARFAELRERDLDAAATSEAERALVNVTPAHDWPNMEPPGPRKPPEPAPPKTVWTLRDDGFDP